MTSKASFFLTRAIEVALIIFGAFIFIGDGDGQLNSLAIWDLIAVVYIAIRIVRMRRSGRADQRSEWLDRGLGGKFGLIFTILSSLVGISAGIAIVVDDGDQQVLAKALGVPAVLLAWAILHFGYAERYAKQFYSVPPEEAPLAFPNCERPSFVEFAYFSFTLGTTFSVSDVETQTTDIRRQILAHSILAFIYNTASIGIAVSVITG
ncbi:MAG TPA: DUF1345 domain-containing protein [Actinoplanes sp.]|nr:DUF1345 domain-containing protein [Actinoplanes sp.]